MGIQNNLITDLDRIFNRKEKIRHDIEFFNKYNLHQRCADTEIANDPVIDKWYKTAENRLSYATMLFKEIHGYSIDRTWNTK
jgi:hypothetical protein